jgi:hypothetical protein
MVSSIRSIATRKVMARNGRGKISSHNVKLLEPNLGEPIAERYQGPELAHDNEAKDASTITYLVTNDGNKLSDFLRLRENGSGQEVSKSVKNRALLRRGATWLTRLR